VNRTLNDTSRKVRIVIDNFTRTEAENDGYNWSAGASIDGTIVTFEVYDLNPDAVLAKLRVALEHSGELDDLPVPVPEKDKAALFVLLRGILATWGEPSDLPDWRENEYIRGQLELITETCRVVTDEEWERGDGDLDLQRDRITDWIKARVWED
jgi:hypothetical protein